MGTISPVEGDGLLHPRGPLPPEVYWRRRLIVLGASLLALMFLFVQCTGGDTKKAASTSPTSGSASPKSSAKSPAKPSTKPSATPTGKAPAAATTSKAAAGPAASSKAAASPAAPSPSVAPAAPTACTVPGLQVSVKASGVSYGAGALPVFTMSIKNSGTTPCTRDLGTAAIEFVVTSGSDRIWSSDDCNKGTPKPTTLKPGEVRTVPVTWNRKRSKAGDSCVGPAALPGNYRVAGRLGDLSTLKDAFQLTS